MNPLLLIGAAVAGAVLYTRRKTLNDDAKAVQTAAKDGANKVNELVRKGKTAAVAEEDTVLDLDAETEAEDVATSGQEAAESKSADAN